MGVVAASKRTRADSVAKLTAACVAGSRFSTFSMRAAHAAQVIPSSVRSTWSAAADGGGGSAGRGAAADGETNESIVAPYTPARYPVKYPGRV